MVLIMTLTLIELSCEKTCLFFWVSDTNWAVQPQKITKGLKFQIHEEEGLYYQHSEKKINHLQNAVFS